MEMILRDWLENAVFHLFSSECIMSSCILTQLTEIIVQVLQ